MSDNEYTTHDVVDAAINGEVASLEQTFDYVMRQKINQALEGRKQEIGLSLGEVEEDE